MIGAKLLLLLHNVVYFLVEGEEILISDGLSLARVESHAQIIELCLALHGCFFVVEHGGTSISSTTTTSVRVGSWSYISPFWCCH